MSTMAVIVPTRGRPKNVRRLIEAWLKTKAEATLWFGFDDDDETLDLAMQTAVIGEFGVDVRISDPLPRTNMNGTLNALALRAAVEYDIVGFMGDDHCPRTRHWDKTIASHMVGGPSIVYGNDLMQGPLLATAVFMTSDIIRTLGYMAPPQMKHLFLDNSWMAWGQGTERISYLPEVVIEHMHPQAGKAEWDEGHIRVNAGEMWEHDAAAYADYVDTGRQADDIEKIKALI